MEHTKMRQVFGVSPEELRERILTDVRAEIKSLAQNFQPIIPTEYLTRQETAEILKVSLVTLSDWNKKKILNPKYPLKNPIKISRMSTITIKKSMSKCKK